MSELPVTDWGRAGLDVRLDEALAVYVEAMGYPARVAAERRPWVERHLDQPGLRAVGVVDETGAVVGFGYGYRGRPGQWWHDEVARGLARAAALDGHDRSAWLEGCFEVCELHVRPVRQGHGYGRRLLRALLTGTRARTALLSTPDRESPARGLYRAEGFVDLLTGFRFPGDEREFAVLGARLPLGSG